MKVPDKLFVHTGQLGLLCASKMNITGNDTEYIRKDALLEWVKLAYGKVSMNPFDCSDAFEELIGKIESL